MWKLLEQIIRNQTVQIQLTRKIMASVADITTALAGVQATATSIETTIQTLQAQGPGITPAELDPVFASLQTLGTGLSGVETSLQALVTPAA